MTTNLKKTIANNLAVATVLLSSGMPFAATIMPANALSKSDVNHASMLSLTPQKSITIAQNSNISFPVGRERQDSVKKKSYMKTSFSLDSSGNLQAVTRTWTSRKFSGFTGGVFIVLTDKSGYPIWNTEQHRYGVDGKVIGRSNRTETWQATVPKDILGKVGGYAIVQQHTPKGGVLKAIRKWTQSSEGKQVIKALTVIIL